MLRFDNVTYGYDDGLPILRGLNFSVEEGEFVFIIGKSGSGKSTVLRLIYMNMLPDEGTVRFDRFDSDAMKPKRIPKLRRNLGVVFQDFKLLKERTVFENIAYVLEVIKLPRNEIKRKVNDVLYEVDLNHKRNNLPNELSGGEQQRVAIARAIVNDPKLVIADEPTGNLDPKTSFEILDIFKKINAKGTAVLIATHQYDLIKEVKAKIIKIDKGKAFNVKIKRSE